MGHPLVGPGLVLWHPRGARLRELICGYWRDEHDRAGYEQLVTPHMGKAELWDTSGHSDFYADGMFSPVLVPQSGPSPTTGRPKSKTDISQSKTDISQSKTDISQSTLPVRYTSCIYNISHQRYILGG